MCQWCGHTVDTVEFMVDDVMIAIIDGLGVVEIKQRVDVWGKTRI